MGDLLFNLFQNAKTNTTTNSTNTTTNSTTATTNTKTSMVNLIKDKKCTIVDVRTPAEFMGGHVKDSINIPLQEITLRMDEIKELKSPIVLCCASGARSGMATQILSREGIECHNGGPWLDVNYYNS